MIRKLSGGYVFCGRPSSSQVALMKTNGFRFGSPEKGAWGTKDLCSIARSAEMIAMCSDEAAKDAKRARAKMADLLAMSRQHERVEIDVELSEGMELMPFQTAGVSYMLTAGRALNACPMGLGKTPMGIACIKYLFDHDLAKTALIVCPASLKYNWQNELMKFTGLESSVICSKDKPQRCRIAIINYDILKKFRPWIHAQMWDILIIDEAHYIKSHKAARTKELAAIKSRYFFALSGTPMPNNPSELWTVLNMARPDVFPDRWRFINDHCYIIKDHGHMKIVGGKNLERLSNRMRATCMYRVRKEDVLRDLPPKRRQIIEVENTLEKKTREELDAFDELERLKKERNELKKKCGETHDVEEHRNAMEAFAEKNQACAVAYGKLSTARKELAVSKVPVCLEHILSVLESEDKLVVFVYHKESGYMMCEALNSAGIKTAFMCGDTPPGERQEMRDMFQDGDLRVIIGSFGAMGTGWTLTAASVSIFTELDWVPATLDQAEDRCLSENNLVLCLRSDNVSGTKGDTMSLVKISDIKIGDTVISHTGTKRVVVDAWGHEHRGMMTRVHYVGWEDPIECTHDHKILVKREGDVVWIRACDALPSDSVAFPKQMGFSTLQTIEIKKEWRAFDRKKTECSESGCKGKIVARGMCSKHYQIWKKITDKSSRKTPERVANGRYVFLPDRICVTNDILYMLGWYAAEGFSSIKGGKGSFVSLSGHKKEEHVLRKIARLFDSWGVRWTIYEKKGTNGIELRAYSYELAMWLMSWFGHRAKNKMLPEEIMNITQEQAAVFLRGYTDGDGYQRKRQVEWVSASSIMCYQMCLLAIRAGFIPTMRSVVHKSKSDGVERTHYIGGYTKFGKRGRLRDQDSDYIYRPIRKVETYCDKVFVYDITVDKDESFTTGFSTVHNCHRIGQANPVLIQYLILKDSLDSIMIRKLVVKGRLVDKVME
jgi:superfamily II DNA or RNA helicase/intein/homing endonuclease